MENYALLYIPSLRIRSDDDDVVVIFMKRLNQPRFDTLIIHLLFFVSKATFFITT